MNPSGNTAENPLLKFPHDHACVCSSGKQFRRCCLKFQPARIPQDWARKLNENWDRLLSGKLILEHPEKAKLDQNAALARMRRTQMKVVKSTQEGRHKLKELKKSEHALDASKYEQVTFPTTPNPNLSPEYGEEIDERERCWCHKVPKEECPRAPIPLRRADDGEGQNSKV